MKTVIHEVDGRPLPLLVSEVIPAAFSHGFTTRAGGVSRPPYDTLNFGRSWGDDPAAVTENRARLLSAAGAPELFLVRQVHGAKVVRVAAGAAPADLHDTLADGLCTDVAGAAIAVFIADCCPVLLADARTGACAAVHAGWRGVVGGIATAAVARLRDEFGARPEDLRAAIGPSIGPCCFEVGPEVVEAFENAHPFVRDDGAGIVTTPGGGKPHIDMWRTLRVSLERAGVPAAGIETAQACTRCDPAGRFYSFRRDANKTGQQLGFIARRA